MNIDNINIKCIEVIQPIGKFYVGKISWQDLLKISYSDIRRIQNEEAGIIDSYLGIQRELSPTRLKEISKYVSFTDATFPSSIVLSVNKYDEDTNQINIIGYDEEKGILSLANNDKVAQIIDGQHRVFGIKKYVESINIFKEEFRFELIISLFVDVDPDDQSMIFSTINKAQTKVNKSLVYDLYDLAKTRSPQRTAHNIVMLLHQKDESPLKGMVKRLGVANNTEIETITQATIVECILKYISNKGQELEDRDILKKGSKLKLVDDKTLKKLIFRNWFIKEKDAQIAKVIWNYLDAIKTKWPKSWGNSILTKSTGIIAFMKFLDPLVNEIGIEKIVTKEEFLSILNEIDLIDGIDNEGDFNINKYIPGAKGQSDLYKDLLTKSGLNKIIIQTSICKKAHRFDKIFESLPVSQKFYSKDERHKCAGCAYDQGYNDALNGHNNEIRLEELNVSQAGTVRHKDPLTAYQMGYEDGLKNKK